MQCPETGEKAVLERYSQAARLTLFWARYFAGEAGGKVIETEHLLLGVLRSDQTLAVRVLGSPWAAETVWKKIEQIKPSHAKVSGALEIPLSTESKRVLTHVLKEADLFPNSRIGTQHLLLGLLREESCLAAKILSVLGVQFVSTRDALSQAPHDDAKMTEFTREQGPLPQDVIELLGRVNAIKARLQDAISRHDFDEARARSEEEGVEREKLRQLYRRYGLLNWIYD